MQASRRTGSADTGSRTDSGRACTRRLPQALFLGSAYAGHATRFANLERNVARDGRFDATFQRVTGWKHGGLIERATVFPKGLRGRVRATLEAASFARLPRPDVIWTSASEVLLPYAWAQAGCLRRPLILDLDATRTQIEEMAPHYGDGQRPGSFHDRFARSRERLLWSSVSLFTPWSNWAAHGLRQQGVDSSRIEVIPPGVDLDRWEPTVRSIPEARRIRLLFVGGDFARKGGNLLLDVLRSEVGRDFELDIVTRDPVQESSNVRVHRLESDDRALSELFGSADAFVMPSLAECFGLATVEAMAAGLPVIVSDRGGVADIVETGRTGFIVEPNQNDLAAVLRSLACNRSWLPTVGREGRKVAEARFNSSVNDARILDRIEALAEKFASRDPGHTRTSG